MDQQRRIQLPHNWSERHYQSDLWDYLMGGGKRAMAVWHRRAGKDEVAMHFAAVEMHRHKGINAWHCLPEYAQGRKAIWSAVNPHTGKRRVDEAFPPELRETTNDNEMFIRFASNGSTWQIIGSDKYDSTVGASPKLITYSEYALSNPSAWAYHRPMLQENNGTAIFITTPRGRNHAYDLAQYAAKTKGWFYQSLTARDTGVLNEQQLDEALAEYQALYGFDVGRAQFESEYLVSWNAAVLGAYYAHEMLTVREEGRVTDQFQVPPGQEVHRAWDLGVTDDTSIWWFTPAGNGQLLILDCYCASGVGLEHYRDVIEQRQQEHGWRHGVDYVPHDAKIKEWGSGRTRVETMQSMGLRPVLVRHATVEDGINAARQTLPLCVFHPRCELSGLNALELYRREWNDEKKCFRQSALHDWTSHACDAFRYLAMAWRPRLRHTAKPSRQPTGLIIPPPPEPRAGEMRL